MVRLKYNCLHIPEKCTCEHHKKDQFLYKEDYQAFTDERKAFQELMKWNSHLPCWVYAPLSIERI